MYLRNIMISEQERTMDTAKKIEKRIRELPKGNLKVYKNGKYYKYKVAKGDKYILLTQKDKELTELLAMKAVYEDMITSINKYNDNIDCYLKSMEGIDISGAKFLSDNPGVAAIVGEKYISNDKRIAEWEHAKYSSSAGYPEKLIFSTLKGHKVRSKAEMTISNHAYIQHVPYRYECDMILKNGSVTTDFIFKNPMTMIEIPLEHLGMLEIVNYFNKTTEKIKNYISSGFIPSVNMLISFELEDKPLDTVYVQKLFDQFWGMSAIRIPWKPSFKYPVS